MLPLLPTTLVGSYAQPDWLIDRENLGKRFPPRVRASELWRVAPEWLEKAQDDATIIAIRDQERAGLDTSPTVRCGARVPNLRRSNREGDAADCQPVDGRIAPVEPVGYLKNGQWVSDPTRVDPDPGSHSPFAVVLKFVSRRGLSCRKNANADRGNFEPKRPLSRYHAKVGAGESSAIIGDVRPRTDRYIHEDRDSWSWQRGQRMRDGRHDPRQRARNCFDQPDP
jgi:hypothetical protein